jgi:hypothetical protein
MSAELVLARDGAWQLSSLNRDHLLAGAVEQMHKRLAAGVGMSLPEPGDGHGPDSLAEGQGVLA